ncbi:MAG: type 1 glutamine amidotransferase [Burkholderiales bacterium]|nr:type 1 glutamine amidotransferase [Burkholderiales bacterium]
MKPILVLQTHANDGPAYFGHWLAQQGLAMDVRNAGAAERYPNTLRDHAGLVLLGGEMSVNDDLPFLRTAEQLVREAIASNVPMLGHCLGGQLMARALGAPVGPSPRAEIGWHRLRLRDTPETTAWLGDEATDVFHWHYESFALPPGARWLAETEGCPHQAFALGPHLAMQFHVELDAAKLEVWLTMPEPSYDAGLAAGAPSVQPRDVIRRQAERGLEGQQRLADRIYGRWLAAIN